MSRDELDDAIDRAVRDIMGAEPPAGLRHRVLLRLATPEPRFSSSLLRFAVVAGVAACVTVAALVVREYQPAPPVSVTAPAAVSPIAAPPVVVAQDRGPVTAAPSPARQAPIRGLPGRLGVPGPGMVAATSIAESGRTTVQVEPLDPLRAIEIAPAASTALTLDEITVAPLLMDAVRVDPLLSTPR